MKNREKYLLKNMGILTISNFASKILVFLLVPLYTNVLSTMEYGIYDLVISTVSLLYPILTMNIVDAVMRFSMDKSYSKNEIATVGIKYVLCSVIILSMGLFIIDRVQILQSIRGYEIYVLLYYTFYTLNQFFIQFAKGIENVTAMGCAGVLSTAGMILTNILFLLVFKWGLAGFFGANILSQAISVIYLFFKLKFWNYWNKEKVNVQVKKEMLTYSIPLIVVTIGWWANSTADKYVVSIMCGISENGILSVAYKIPQILNILQAIFIQAWQISAIKEYGNNSTSDFYGKTFSCINIMMCAACSWLILLSKPLASFLYADDFYVAWQYVPFLLISSVFNCAAGMLGPILSAQKDAKAMAKSAVYGTVANIIMNFIFIYLIGVQGATVATVISSIIIYYVRKKSVGDNIKIVNYVRILVTWSLLCVQAILAIYLQCFVLEIFVMVVMLLINRKYMLELIKDAGCMLKG